MKLYKKDDYNKDLSNHKVNFPSYYFLQVNSQILSSI
jgi:hypothetical protein